LNQAHALEQNIKDYNNKEIVLAKEELIIYTKDKNQELKLELSKEFQIVNLRLLDIQK